MSKVLLKSQFQRLKSTVNFIVSRLIAEKLGRISLLGSRERKRTDPGRGKLFLSKS